MAERLVDENLQPIVDENCARDLKRIKERWKRKHPNPTIRDENKLRFELYQRKYKLYFERLDEERRAQMRHDQYDRMRDDRLIDGRSMNPSLYEQEGRDDSDNGYRGI